MDQGVLEALKRKYRRSMLQKLLLQDQAGQSVIEGINMKDVVFMSADAWDDILAVTLNSLAVTLNRSWNKILTRQMTQMNNQRMLIPKSSVESLAKELDHNLSDQDITDWMNEDLSDPGYQVFTDKEIIQRIVGASTEKDTCTDVADDHDELTTISSGQAAEICWSSV